MDLSLIEGEKPKFLADRCEVKVVRGIESEAAVGILRRKCLKSAHKESSENEVRAALTLKSEFVIP